MHESLILIKQSFYCFLMHKKKLLSLPSYLVFPPYSIYHVCMVKHNFGMGFCQHFGLIGLIATKFYSDSFSTKKHSLDYYHCIIWLYYCLPLLYINAPCPGVKICLYFLPWGSDRFGEILHLGEDFLNIDKKGGKQSSNMC